MFINFINEKFVGDDSANIDVCLVLLVFSCILTCLGHRFCVCLILVILRTVQKNALRLNVNVRIYIFRMN